MDKHEIEGRLALSNIVGSILKSKTPSPSQKETWMDNIEEVFEELQSCRPKFIIILGIFTTNYPYITYGSYINLTHYSELYM